MNNQCQRCGKKVGSEVCHLNAVTMEEEENTNLFQSRSIWLCMDCWRELTKWVTDEWGKRKETE